MPTGVYKRTKKHRFIISKSLLGNKYSLGYKHSLETKKKMRLSSLGKKKSESHRKKISLYRKNKPRPELRGSNCYNWKGGITPINKILRSSIEYKIWREAVFKRDNWTCIWCFARSMKGKRVYLHADHIKPFAFFPELRFAIDNGRTLCIECHRTTETFGRKNYEK